MVYVLGARDVVGFGIGLGLASMNFILLEGRPNIWIRLMLLSNVLIDFNEGRARFSSSSIAL